MSGDGESHDYDWGFQACMADKPLDQAAPSGAMKQGFLAALEKRRSPTQEDWRHTEFVRGFDLARNHKPLPADASPPAKRGYIDALSVAMPSPVRSTVRRLLSEGIPC